MEDLRLNLFWKKGESDEAKMSKLPSYSHENGTCVFPEFLKKETKPGFNMESEGCYWYSPVSLDQLQKLLQTNDEIDQDSREIIVKNTAMGYYKERFNKYIDLSYVPELSIIRKDQSEIELGSSVTISKVIEALREGNEHREGILVFEKHADHMEKITSWFVRNSASIGRNLIIAQRKQFPSGIATILLSVDTIVHILIDQKHENIMIEEFLERSSLDSKSALLSIKIPSWSSSDDISSETNTKLPFETNRAAPRPFGNALPYMNAAFLVEISLCSAGIMLNNYRLAFGAYGTKHTIRAMSVEDFLFAHEMIAKCLGLPGRNVRVITRRVGGGFGGKAT